MSELESLILEELSSMDELEDEMMTRLSPIFDIEDDDIKTLLAMEEDKDASSDFSENDNYIEDTVILFSDQEFQEHFRLSRRVVAIVVEKYRASTIYQESVRGRYGKLTAYEQTLIFLWFAGHQTTSYRDVADRFNVTISSLFRVNMRLIHFISNLSEEVIRWPSLQEQQVSEAAFRAMGFPQAIGAVDGTQIRIDKPSDDPESYRNRKNYFSVQMQAVCDHAGKIRSVFIGFPGSVHDARVFRRSDFETNMSELCGDKVVLADSAYPCRRNLITPFEDSPRLATDQRNFNKILNSCRSVIERCFGSMKQRFRQLYHCKLRSMVNICHFIRACAVLHNFVLDDDPEFSFSNTDDVIESDDDEVAFEEEDDDIEPDSNEGVAYRNYLMNLVGR